MNEAKLLLASWARSFLAASIACYLAGVTDWKALFGAGAAAVLPVILRFLNRADLSFGLTK
jgi:hypothetical protein